MRQNFQDGAAKIFERAAVCWRTMSELTGDRRSTLAGTHAGSEWPSSWAFPALRPASGVSPAAAEGQSSRATTSKHCKLPRAKGSALDGIAKPQKRPLVRWFLSINVRASCFLGAMENADTTPTQTDWNRV
jgi:hypothetical protein